MLSFAKKFACLSLSVAACTALSLAHAQQSSGTAPEPSYVPSASAQPDRVFANKGDHLLYKLPPGVDPNPPSPDELKADHLLWNGEYEATKDGQLLLGPDNRPIPVLYTSKGKRLKLKVATTEAAISSEPVAEKDDAADGKEKGKAKVVKAKVPKVKPPHSLPLTVVAGTLTVDGWTGKARLNYDIPPQSYLYFSTPSIGTVIVSQNPFPGAKEQKAAIEGNSLTLHVAEHDLQLTSEKPLAAKKIDSLWVSVDPEFRRDPRYPVMGFGPSLNPPYAWPAAKSQPSAITSLAPPLPVSMRPSVVTPVCIAQPNRPCPATPAPAPAPPVSQPASAPPAAH